MKKSSPYMKINRAEIHSDHKQNMISDTSDIDLFYNHVTHSTNSAFLYLLHHRRFDAFQHCKVQ